MQLKDTLKYLAEGNTLSFDQAKNTLSNITEGNNNDVLLSSFLTMFMMRDITAQELGGFRQAMLEKCIPVDLGDYDTIDLCGTGGDGKNTFNISTLTSFIVAGAGLKVTKHGNYGVSSGCGSSNILEALGIKFSNDNEIIKSDIENNNICFLHAPLFHPAAKHVAPVRKSLGMKTFFNMLGPMLNPSNPSHQVVGVYSEKLARLYKEIYSTLETKYSIIYSLDGYDEISLTSDFLMISNREEAYRSPDFFGFNKVTQESIYGGGSIGESKQIFLDILQGKGTQEQNNVVIANAAIAIKCLKPEYSIMDCIQIALDSILGKQAFYVLKRAVERCETRVQS